MGQGQNSPGPAAPGGALSLAGQLTPRCCCSGSRRRATTPRRPSCATAPRALERLDEPRRVPRRTAASCRKSRAAGTRACSRPPSTTRSDAPASRCDELDGIAVTAGPGLIGSLVVGVATAKALAFATGKPLYAVNHLHGHSSRAFLERAIEPPYPFLALLVSGGHSQLVEVESARDLRIDRARTRDDAAGEAFDKTARLLGLPFPGGPALEALARDGDPAAIAFPRYRPEPGALDLSFSGLKTSARYFLASDAGARRVARRRRGVVSSGDRRRADRPRRTARSTRVPTARSCSAAASPRTLPSQRRFRYLGERRDVRDVRPRAPLLHRQRRDDRRGRGPPGRTAHRADPLTLTADPNLPFEPRRRRSRLPRGGSSKSGFRQRRARAPRTEYAPGLRRRAIRRARPS